MLSLANGTMYRNLYDTDVTTWSPQGRIHQVEYAMEGVKLGTCGVGLRSNTDVVSANEILPSAAGVEKTRKLE